MDAIKLLCILFGLLNYSSIIYGQNAMSAETLLKQHLMTNYDKDVRPMYNPNAKMTISMSFSLKNIERLDEKNQVMKSFGWIMMFWKDEMLVWDPAKYSNTYRLVMPADKIWLPEIAMINSVSHGDDLSMGVKFRASISHDGSVFFAPGFKWETECKVDLTTFPFDSQSCNVSFVNWIYGANSLAFHTTGVDIRRFDPNDEWDLTSASSEYFEWTIPDSGGLAIPQVYFTVNLTRRATYYTMNVLIPTFLIAVITCLVFVLPSDAGEKVSLSITVLLSYTVILLMVSDVTPRSGIVLPWITIFIILCMGETTLSMIITIILLNFYHHPGNKPVCACVRNFIFGPLATMVCMRKDLKIRNISSSKVAPRDQETNLSQMLRRSSLKAEDLDIVKTKHDLPEDVVVYLRYLMQKEKDQEEEDNYKAEWIAMAKILDRFSFYAFLVITAAGLLAFLMGIM